MKETPIRYLKGVGPSKEIIFNNLGIYTAKDLLRYFPFRYEDRRNFKKIKDIQSSETVVLKAKVSKRNLKKLPYFLHNRKIKSIFEVTLEDDTGKIKCTWFNQPYLYDSIELGCELIVYGKVRFSNRGIQIISPDYELGKIEESLSIGRIIGVYSLPAAFNQRFIRKTMADVLKTNLKDFPDPLPFAIRKEKNIPNVSMSLQSMHFPSSLEAVKLARERFIFEEFFFSQILVYIRKAKRASQRGFTLQARASELEKIKKNFSFNLTSSQKQSLSEILTDLKKSMPMHRLLQGDVGCGKTIVAAFAMAVCADSGFQAALMVPTEILAYQHKETLEEIFKGLEFTSGKGKRKVIRVITSSLTKKEKQKIYKDLQEGKIKVIVGTHSLLQEEVIFQSLGLVIIDEQHRFGVAQRALLPKKGKPSPHCLVMSATPIPRSLALSIYGDLDFSVIKDMPAGRIQPQTLWVKERKRKWVYNFLEDKVNEGRQVYVVYPVIEESETEDLKSVKTMHDKIKARFCKFSVAMFHGKMKPDEKIKIIKAFRHKKIDILVCTTVVEVGVNIENAAVMVVENPERFGLAQLHQLRGRIQRSTYEPHFILISKSNLSENSSRRLEIISKETSGFKISEEDLKLRGPGDFFGNIQHGLPALPVGRPDLKIANPLKDLEILNQARKFAYQVIKTDPNLETPQNRPIKDHLTAQTSKGFIL